MDSLQAIEVLENGDWWDLLSEREIIGSEMEGREEKELRHALDVAIEALQLKAKQEQGLVVEISCEGCQHDRIYSTREWNASQCAVCARFAYSELLDRYISKPEAEAAKEGLK